MWSSSVILLVIGLNMVDAVSQLCSATQRLELGSPLTVFVSLDTEGTSRTGLREVAAVVIGDEDTYFFDTVTPTLKAKEGLAPQDARRTWAHVGARFWKWLSELGDEIVVFAHNGIAHDAPLMNNETMLQCPEALVSLRGRLWLVDTLHLVRHEIPFEELRDRQQGAVYKHLFGADPMRRHTALGDARALVAIVEHPRLQPRARAQDVRKQWPELKPRKKEQSSK